MKTVGIVGGIAPESTIEYYRQIIYAYRAQSSDGDYPSIIINSINLRRMIDLITANELAAVTEYLLDAIGKLARAVADFAVLASNTPHIVFDELRARASLVAAHAEGERVTRRIVSRCGGPAIRGSALHAPSRPTQRER